jgi:hypothetical protein
MPMQQRRDDMQTESEVTEGVEKVFRSLEASQRNIADQWSQVMRNANPSSQADITEAFVRSQNELLRRALRSADPAGLLGTFSSAWLTLPQGFATTALELQRKMLEAWTRNDDLRPEAIAQRWSRPWFETIRAYQEAFLRLIDLHRGWGESLTSQSSRAAYTQGTAARSRSTTSQRPRQPRSSTNGRRRTAAQRAH